MRGRRFALVYLEDVLGLARDAGQSAARTLVIVRPASGKPYALSVANVFDQEELVIRPAPPQIMGAGVYAGTTLPDSGRPMLLIDPQGVAVKARIFEDAHALDRDIASAQQASDITKNSEQKTLLVREFDGKLRAVNLSVVDRVEDVGRAQIAQTAGQWRVTIGDDIFPIFAESIPENDSHIKLMRMTDGTSHVAYPIADVVDIVTGALDMVPSHEEGIAMGVALIDGAQVEIIDPYWVFSQAGQVAETDAGSLPVCRIDHGDEQWVMHFLAPMIEAAGYRIVVGEQGQEAVQPSMIIRSAHQDGQDRGIEGAKVIRLRAHVSKLRSDDDSIYRYDRNALISALRSGQGG